MSPLPAPQSALSWTEEIGAEAELLMNAKISLYDLSKTVALPYDPETDTGGYAVPQKLVTSKARIVKLRNPSSGVTGSEPITTRPYRYQIPLREYRDLIEEGILLRVDDGGDDPELTHLAFIVKGATNGSHAAVRTIETVTEGNKVAPVAA